MKKEVKGGEDTNLEKKDKLDALISEIQGYRNRVEEIEDKVRSALRNLPEFMKITAGFLISG